MHPHSKSLGTLRYGLTDVTEAHETEGLAENLAMHAAGGVDSSQ